MPVELRKRKAHQQPAAAAPAPKKAATKPKAPAKQADKEDKAAAKTTPNGDDEKKKAPSKVAPGDVINLDGFGGDIETNEGVKTSLKKLVDESKSGVVLFTYPKASTPGCAILSLSTPPLVP